MDENNTPFPKLKIQHEMDQSSVTQEANKSKDECLVCMDKPLSVALVPCGHVCYCLECAERETVKECPNCRSKVDEMQRIYR